MVKTPRVLIATPVGPGKEYCRAFFGPAVQSLIGGAAGAGVECGLLLLEDGARTDWPGVPQSAVRVKLGAWRPKGADPFLWGRIARARERARLEFMAGKWTHVYWHDCDMWPEADTVPRLLAHAAPIASGIYPIRGLPTPTAAIRGDADGLALRHCGLMRAEDTFRAAGAGMGCMLVSRAAAETPFRPEIYWADLDFDRKREDILGEDYQWCADADPSGHGDVLIDCAVSPWHAGPEKATRIAFGEMTDGVVWAGSSYMCRNGYGDWIRGVPRLDIPADQAKDLGPEFLHGRMRYVSLDKADTASLGCEA